MTWEIVVGIIALIGVFVTVGGVVFKLSRILASLEATIKTLDGTLKELKASNRESHKEFYTRIEEHDKVITDHEGRIHRLEEN